MLADDGTLWLNLGDSYAGGGGFSPSAPSSATSKSGRYGSLGALKSGGIRPQVARLRLRTNLTEEQSAYVLEELVKYSRMQSATIEGDE